MPRLKAIETPEAEPKTKALLEGVQKKLGMTPNLMRTMANSPAVLEAYLGLGNALGKGTFQPRSALVLGSASAASRSTTTRNTPSSARC